MRPLQKKKKNPNNSCIRNLSQAICMPSIHCNFFWVSWGGGSCAPIKSNKNDPEMHLHQNGRHGQKAGGSDREGTSPPCSGSHACHSHNHPEAVGPSSIVTASVVRWSFFGGGRGQNQCEPTRMEQPLGAPSTTPPCPPCHPSIHLKCNFKIFSTTPSAVRIAFGRIPLKLQTNPSPLSEHSLHARNCILGSGCGCDSGHCDSGSVCSNSGSTNALPRPADGAQDSGLTQKLGQSH